MTKLDDIGLRTKQAVDAVLSSLLDERISSSKQIHESYHQLWQTIRSVTLHGGKRIRPQLTMVGYGAFDENILPIATAQELLHTAMLMHDDVIDRDTMRHGRLNVNGSYAERYQSYLNEQNAIHHSHSAGILAGDLLISEAYQLIANSNLKPATKQAVSARLGQSIFEVVGGELLDVEAAFMHDVELDPLTVARYKTASYTFMGPLLSGALCREASPDTLAALKAYALPVGIAFQLQDDLLGTFGDEATTGKSTLNDLREGKRTYLIDRYKATLTSDTATELNAFGKHNASETELENLKTAIIRSGAKAQTETTLHTYYQQALEALDQLENSEQRAWLEALTEKLIQRVA